jgi:tRNA(fMet)-specific endonuclease VapC
MLYLLDTSIVSHVIKGDNPLVLRRLACLPMHQIVISVITQAELYFGVAKRGHPKALANRVEAFLLRVAVLAWTADVSATYASMRASCEAAGVTLGPMDMLIAAHARALGAILVSSDRTFRLVPSGLTLEDWTEPD